MFSIIIFLLTSIVFVFIQFKVNEQEKQRHQKLKNKPKSIHQQMHEFVSALFND